MGKEMTDESGVMGPVVTPEELARIAAPGAWQVVVNAERADAMRYRFLRDNPWPPELRADIMLHRNARWDDEIDAAIRAARSAGQIPTGRESAPQGETCAVCGGSGA